MSIGDYVQDAIRSARGPEDLYLKLNPDAIGRAGLAALLAVAIFNAHLLGRAQVFADVHPTLAAAAVDIKTSFEPLPFEEAIDFFRNKTPMSPERFRALSAAARAKAFTIADGANRQVRDSIMEMLNRALSSGLTMEEFRDEAIQVLDNAGIAPRRPVYWETVYRTNMSTSYQAGRWQQMTDPDVVKERPYLRYVSARLPTTRPSHGEKHGLVFAADDPFWSRWYPPNGFNCYCTVMSVSESLLKRRGWTVSTAQNFSYPDPDPGFGTNAGRSETV